MIGQAGALRLRMKKRLHHFFIFYKNKTGGLCYIFHKKYAHYSIIINTIPNIDTFKSEYAKGKEYYCCSKDGVEFLTKEEMEEKMRKDYIAYAEQMADLSKKAEKPSVWRKSNLPGKVKDYINDANKNSCDPVFVAQVSEGIGKIAFRGDHLMVCSIFYNLLNDLNKELVKNGMSPDCITVK